MGQPYVGEIRMFAGNFEPAGWYFCDGRLLPISENETLFQLIGTTYGGDGQETFGLPDLRGRIPVHQGQGPGIAQSYQMGEMAGVESVTLTTQQIPAHNHAFFASTALGTQINADGQVLANPTDIKPYLRDSPSSPFPANMLEPIGGSQPHDNLPPTLVINYIISLYGVFPHQ